MMSASWLELKPPRYKALDASTTHSSCRRLERSWQVHDVSGAIFPQVDNNDIETKGPACREPAPDQGGCHGCDMVLLAGIDSTGSQQDRITGLHLDHDHNPAIGRFCDQVDLTAAKAQVSSKYPVPPASQPSRSLAFSKLAEAGGGAPVPCSTTGLEAGKCDRNDLHLHVLEIVVDALVENALDICLLGVPDTTCIDVAIESTLDHRVIQ